MSAHSEVVQWAVKLLRAKVTSFEKVRCKGAKSWSGGKRLHKVRTQARRLRALAEDLEDCVARPEGVDRGVQVNRR